MLGADTKIPEMCVNQVAALRAASRHDILRALGKRPALLVELAKTTGIARQTISRHLHALERARFLTPYSHGSWTYYRLTSLGEYVIQTPAPTVRLTLPKRSEKPPLPGVWR